MEEGGGRREDGGWRREDGAVSNVPGTGLAAKMTGAPPTPPSGRRRSVHREFLRRQTPPEQRTTINDQRSTPATQPPPHAVASVSLRHQTPDTTTNRASPFPSKATMAARRALLGALPLRSSLGSPARLMPAAALPQRRHDSSSTSAINYKALHRRSAPLPTSEPTPAWSAPAAVSSILYETPLPSHVPAKRHVLNCLVQNEPGVLSRVSGILAARGFNIDSLVVCNTEVEDLSRMTIVLQGQDGVVEQARRQLEDLVPVWAVLDYTGMSLVQRELLLAKVSILGPEYFEELLAHHREMTGLEEEHMDGPPPGDEAAREQREAQARAVQQRALATEQGLARDFHPSKLAASQALRHKHEHLQAITNLTHQFGGKVLDISTNNCIVEVSAKPTRIDSFMKLVQPFGVLESTRTGEPRVVLTFLKMCACADGDV